MVHVVEHGAQVDLRIVTLKGGDDLNLAVIGSGAAVNLICVVLLVISPTGDRNWQTSALEGLEQVDALGHLTEIIEPAVYSERVVLAWYELV